MPSNTQLLPRHIASSVRRVVGFAVVLCLCIAGCSEENPSEPVTPGGEVVHSYNLRGRIAALPDPNDPVSELRIHHEAIDDFKMGNGEASPMKSMQMPFTPGPGESLEGLAVGDVVSFVFQMQWEPVREMRVVSIEKLPADTALGFESGGGNAGQGEHAGH